MDKVFGIIPASSGAMTFLWVLSIFIAVLIIGIIGLFVSFGYQARHASFTLTAEGLHIGPGLYGRTIPKADISLEGIRILDLNQEKDYQPKWRTNGTGLPGYLAGWFKLQNGEKALAFITDRSSVIYIPTNDNYSVMLSVKDAAGMVEAIKQWDK